MEENKNEELNNNEEPNTSNNENTSISDNNEISNETEVAGPDNNEVSNETEVEDSDNSELAYNNENIDELSNNEEDNLDAKKGSRVLPIVATILAGVVAISVVVLVVLSLLSPKNIYFSLVGNAFSGASKEIGKFEKSVFGEILGINTDSKLALDVKMSGKIETEDAEIKEWVQNLESFELNAKENIDFSNDYSDTTADFSLNGEKFLAGALVQNKNIISAKLDNITDGYLTIDDNNLATFWEKLGYNGPDSLKGQTNLLKNLTFSKSDINDLEDAVSAFGNGFSTVFEDEDFSFGEGTVAYDEGSIACKTMDLFVSAVKFNDALIAGLDKVTSKEKYVDALYKVISSLDKMSGYEPLSREEFGTNFEMMVQQIRGIEFSEEDEGFIARIYYKGSDILKVDILSEDYNTKIFELTLVNNKDSGYYRFYDGMMVYEDKVTTIDDITTHVLNVDYINYETGEIEEGYGSEINITIDNTAKNNQVIHFTEKVRLLSYDDDLATINIMEIEPTTIRDYTLKGSIDENINNLDIVMIDSDSTFSNTFSVNASIKENAEFSSAVINEEENFNVDTATDEAFTAEKDKIINNWNNSVDSTRMGQFETVVSMYLSMFIPKSYNGTEDYSDIDLEGLNIIE